MPKVSIIMPTRNRGGLLSLSLPSALRQTYEDLEVLVSDNFSQDNTQAVISSIRSPKVRSVRTPAALPMPDSWEFALQHARGDYVTFLTDDSYLFPNAIELAIRELKRSGLRVVVWSQCTYFAAEWIEPNRRNFLYIPKTPLQSRLLSSDESLKDLFDLHIQAPVPKLLNSLCSRDLTERMSQLQGRVFFPPCPDFSFAAGVLQHIKEYVFLDRPLFINGLFPGKLWGLQRFHRGNVARVFCPELCGGFIVVRAIST